MTTANRLAKETSPYLLQHKDNPVHWWPWSADALAEAKSTGKPILLSIGYAACHWCHVMAHESFEDPETARLMNDNFINIKVDREERPDIDAVYMAALLRLTDHAGWPLTMFLDPDANPFWGGTYFPPEDTHGQPSFRRVLLDISRIYREEPAKVRQNVEAISRALVARPEPPGEFSLSIDALLELTKRTISIIDPVHGGIRGAPKFPQWSIFSFLWQIAISRDHAQARDAITTVLRNICQGGIYDHLGGGLARYSVDERWLVPHFEKMLYDNAQLIELLTEVWRETRDPLFAQRIDETITWLSREMIADGGGFAASLDADSEGHEGKFYVWTVSEIIEVLGITDGHFFCSVYDIAEEGNFEGRNIPNRLAMMQSYPPADEARLTELRAKLLTARATRVRPGWDDKVLADWNGLTIAALARASIVFNRPDWHDLAGRAFSFVEQAMFVDGRMLHAARNNELRGPATSSDYANMIHAALRLYERASDPHYLECAVAWTAIVDRHYWDQESGGYALTADDTPDVIIRIRSANDDAAPNANAIMAANLVKLFLVTANTSYLGRAQQTIDAFRPELAERLFGHFGLLSAFISMRHPQHLTLAEGSDHASNTKLRNVIAALSLPGAVCQIIPPSRQAEQGKHAIDDTATAYICVGTDCAPPVTDASSLEQQLKHARTVS